MLGADITQWQYLPAIAGQDWIAILDKQGQIQGCLRGDGSQGLWAIEAQIRIQSRLLLF